MGDEQNALNEYVGPYYGAINRYLRGQRTEEDVRNDAYYSVEITSKILDRALNRGELGYDLRLYRYTDSDEFFNLENQQQFKSYLSTSISEDATSHFGDYKIIINAPKTTKGIYLREYSDFPSEKEFLVQRGAKYNILSIDYDKGIVEVELYD